MIQASIVIPVYNDADNLRQTLKAIRNQDYPEEKFEIFVVDNGSIDNTWKIAKSFSFIQLLKEEEYLNSPYSARNRGIEASKGDIIVLLDATCTPVEDWLSKGINCLENNNADIIAGNVRLNISSDSSLSEIYDAITNIQIKGSVNKRKTAPTANLFIRKKVFDSVGLFPEGVRSGADTRWTKQATDEGYMITFCEKAKSKKPARRFLSLIKKQWRVSKGQPAAWAEQGRDISFFYFARILLMTVLFKPFKSEIKGRLKETEYIQYSNGLRIRLEVLNYFIKAIMRIGNLYSYLLK